MQTFLPYPDFELSACVLDKKRCWKQVIEARQIHQALSDETSPSHRFINHPAVQMWKGYEDCLAHYYNVFLSWCKLTHKIRTDLPKIDLKNNQLITPVITEPNIESPSRKTLLMPSNKLKFKTVPSALINSTIKNP